MSYTPTISVKQIICIDCQKDIIIRSSEGNILFLESIYNFYLFYFLNLYVLFGLSGDPWVNPSRFIPWVPGGWIILSPRLMTLKIL